MHRQDDVPFPVPRPEASSSGKGGDGRNGDFARARSETGSTAVLSVVGSSSVASSRSALEGVEAVQWDEIVFRSELFPLRAYAYCGEDVYLLSAFIELTPLQTVDMGAVKLLFRVLRFLRLCDYSVEDICTILAHASSYFLDIYAQCGNQMEAGEVGNVLATLLFLAHCYVQDETCPLGVWHKHLFRKYCPLRVLNAAVLRLLELRGYYLRLEDADLSRRLSHLYSSIERFGRISLGSLGSLRQNSNASASGRRGAASSSTGRGLLSGLAWVGDCAGAGDERGGRGGRSRFCI